MAWLPFQRYALYFSFLSIANILLIVFVKSERELFDKYEQLGYLHRRQIIRKKLLDFMDSVIQIYIDFVDIMDLIACD